MYNPLKDKLKKHNIIFKESNRVKGVIFFLKHEYYSTEELLFRKNILYKYFILRIPVLIIYSKEIFEFQERYNQINRIFQLNYLMMMEDPPKFKIICGFDEKEILKYFLF